MPNQQNNRGEYLKTETQQVRVYFFRDKNQKIDIKSREVFLKKKRVVHYPFKRNGQPRYKRITQIIYQNMPDPLPRGLLKDPNTGYGLTKVLNPVLYALDAKFNITKVQIQPVGKFRIKNGTAYLNYSELNRFYPRMDSLIKTQSGQKDALVAKFLKEYFPAKFKATKASYIKGSLYSIIAGQVDKDTAISKDDYDAMMDLVFARADERAAESKKIVLSTKEKIEQRFFEDAVRDYKKLLKGKSETKALEKKWETYFKENSWVISNLFSLPVLLFANQAYVGGKEIFNANGKITDFLFKNSLTDNLAIIELKTHKTALLSKKPYRGNDVYALSEELSGAISQVLDQRQNLANDFYALRGKADRNEWFESFNPRCLIIAGSIAGLPEKGRRSLEMFRNNLHGIEIITFDEVLEKIQAFASLIKPASKRGRKSTKTTRGV